MCLKNCFGEGDVYEKYDFWGRIIINFDLVGLKWYFYFIFFMSILVDLGLGGLGVIFLEIKI